MREYIEKRAIELGEYIVGTKSTVRSAADRFGISKSTVHYDVSKRLKRIDYELYKEVKEILEVNFGERHLRGGESTRKKYARLNEK